MVAYPFSYGWSAAFLTVFFLILVILGVIF
ncbi:MAG: hypothetical protein AWM53_01456 [Candidatus Dichloromethanomonas elyunquensis]|nr:MAG: hypothetical protein AWM53_01456 [Candidatus Dichloromethanomonas elyunquensis]